jgi:hypothetical protein
MNGLRPRLSDIHLPILPDRGAWPHVKHGLCRVHQKQGQHKLSAGYKCKYFVRRVWGERRDVSRIVQVRYRNRYSPRTFRWGKSCESVVVSGKALPHEVLGQLCSCDPIVIT